MIVVIADDFTGAAEIAGLGMRYGLSVIIESEVVTDSEADLLIIATDTRSMNESDAYNEMYKIKMKLENLDYEWLYKKTDSVFRGHILSELSALLDADKNNKVLLVASNPPLGRKIIDGKYYINGQLLNETGFAQDPEFSTNTADVLTLLGKNDDIDTHLLKTDEEIIGEGIFLGEAGTNGDLIKLAEKVDNEILPAGASGFFAALLESNGYKLNPKPTQGCNGNDKNFLIVLGSTYSKGNIFNHSNTENDLFISSMPDNIFFNEPSSNLSMEKWLNEIVSSFNSHKKIIIEINQPVIQDRSVSKRLKEDIADLVSKVLQSVKISELVIDGGATAYAIVSAIGIKKFYPMHEVAPGVIRMKVDEMPDLCITIKPGSYPMPEEILTA